MNARSLLTGTEDLVTFQIILRYPFHSVSMVWNILKRFCPDAITTQVRGMRAFKDMSGACFDVPEGMATRLEDIFAHASSERAIDFGIERATELPELKEDEFPQNNYGNNSGY